jgi:hemerythrin-like domain-containing protein
VALKKENCPMQPRGPLMIEHRLIERMISLIDKEVKRIENSNVVHQSFIDTAVDFIRFYADRTHHGKEEEILFRDLAKKKLSDVDNRIMNELVQEHIFGRSTTDELVQSADAYQKGDKTALPSITQSLRKFIGFYPNHIEKEEKIFFPSSMTYFSEPEQQSMLNEFREFDGKMIHDKYKSVIEALEK